MSVIINATPHPINLVDDLGNIIKTFELGISIRLESQTVQVGNIDGIPITKTLFGDPIGLPEWKVDVYYIVSAMVKNACPFRSDLLVPSEQVRDASGRIIGCKSLGI